MVGVKRTIKVRLPEAVRRFYCETKKESEIVRRRPPADKPATASCEVIASCSLKNGKGGKNDPRTR